MTNIKRKRKPSVKELQDLLEQHNGNISAVARALGYRSRAMLYKIIHDSEELRGIISDTRETFVDQVESAIYRNALDGNVTAQIFILKAHPTAAARGWRERHEHSGPDGGPIAFQDQTIRELDVDALRRHLEVLGQAAVLLAAGRREELQGHPIIVQTVDLDS